MFVKLTVSLGCEHYITVLQRFAKQIFEELQVRRELPSYRGTLGVLI
jgi:hypothetical protein